MARPSAAALAVVPPSGPSDPLPAPDGLSDAEAEMWREIVDSKPADWFDVDSAPVLKEYIRAATMCDVLDDQVKEALGKGEGDVKKLLDLRDRESRRMLSMATKLRLTQQSQYTAKSAATANGRAGGKRPWQS